MINGIRDSPCFVIALVIFEEYLEAEACAVEIKKLEHGGVNDPKII
jgi:hypothetical protein